MPSLFFGNNRSITGALNICGSRFFLQKQDRLYCLR